MLVSTEACEVHVLEEGYGRFEVRQAVGGFAVDFVGGSKSLDEVQIADGIDPFSR